MKFATTKMVEYLKKMHFYQNILFLRKCEGFVKK